MPDPQSIAALAIPMIKRFEGLRLEAYPDPASGGPPITIGYGATGPDIVMGTVWTQEQADADLAARVLTLANRVNALVTVPLPAVSCAAMVSLAYNVGIHAFSGSSVLRDVNAGEMQGAALAFEMWNKAAGKVNPGLVKRRAQERDLFLSGFDPPLVVTS